MREIRIVITDTSVSFPDGQELGRVGEHNATQLLIELPAEMVEGIDYHIIKFSLLGGAITSDIITEDDSKQIYISDGKIYCTLWQQLTASRGLSFTVEAYAVVDDEPVLIAKSPLVKGLRFEQSVDAGAEADEQGYSIAVHVANLDERVEGKVDKVTGKGLSTNDLTDTLKTDYDDAVSKAHEHANAIPVSKLTEDADGNPLYGGKPIGGVTVVDYYDDLPDDAAEGELAYVRLETELDDGKPLDLSDCPKSSDVSAQIEAAYTAQGGTVGDTDWYDFEQNYTNCNFSVGALKLGVPIYRPDADIDAYFYTALEVGINYDESELLWVRPILFSVGSEQSEYGMFVPDSDYSYRYMSGCAYNTEANGPEEFTENGITKYKMMVAYVYAFESLTGQLHNTGGMFDGLQLNFALGWNSVSLILVLDEGTGDLVAERAEVLPLNDVYLPEYTFWRLTGIRGEGEEAFARSAIPEMITDTTQSIIIPPALYIRADGEWRKTS